MTIAVYAGSFDPMTLGHLSVAARAAAAFEQVIVVVADNPDKQYLFTREERLHLAQLTVGHLANVRCEATSGWVVDLANAKGATVLVRGVRDATDAGYETALAQANRNVAPHIDTFFLPADRELAQVSSSRLREMARSGQDGSAFCNPEVWLRVLAKVRGMKHAPLESAS